jgi:hypothetical protein
LPTIGPKLDGGAASKTIGTGATWSTKPTEKIAEAALDADAARVVRDTMGINFHLPIEALALEKVYRFPVLAHWSFTTSEGATFETLMQGLDDGLIGSLPERPPDAPPAPAVPNVAETGHIELDHQTRRGDATHAWYRGPFVPHPIDREEPDKDGHLVVAHAADQLRRVVPDGREDLTYAAAYEIGRLLALSQLSVVAALLRFRAEQFGAARVKHLIETIVPPVLMNPVDDIYQLGHIVSLGVVEEVASNPGKVVGPSRPIADPGRPLELSASLDSVVAQGLGLNLTTLRQTAKSVGIVAALAGTDVPVVASPATPLLDGPELGAMTTILHNEVERMAGLAASFQPHAAAPGAKPRAAARPPDALDELVDRVMSDKEAER